MFYMTMESVIIKSSKLQQIKHDHWILNGQDIVFDSDSDSEYHTSDDKDFILPSNPMNFIPNDNHNLHSFVYDDVLIVNNFNIKMNTYSGHLKEHFLKDIISHRAKVIEMDKSINPHIEEIFTWNMILHLHLFKISYKSLSKFIIYNNDLKYPFLCENKISSFFDTFKSKDWILSLIYHKQCKLLNLPNFFHPKYHMNEGRPKQFTDEEIKQRRKEQMRLASAKYRKSKKL